MEANLAALGAERLGVVNLRRLDAAPGIIAEGEQRVDLDDQLAELTALRDEGKIGGIGLSNVSAAQLRQALPAGIACVQNSYSVLDRAAEPVLEAVPRARRRLGPVLPARLGRLRQPAQGNGPPRGARRRAPSSASPPRRSAWPGSSRTTTRRC